MVERRVRIEFDGSNNNFYIEENGFWLLLNNEPYSSLKKYTNVAFDKVIQNVFETLRDEVLIDSDDSIEIVLESKKNSKLIGDFISDLPQFSLYIEDDNDKAVIDEGGSVDEPDEEIALTDYCIDERIRLGKGETYLIENKRIFFNSYINSHGGRIVIKNSEIHYGERSCGICVHPESYVMCENSTIICDDDYTYMDEEEYENMTFIHVAPHPQTGRRKGENIKIVFKNCFFVNNDGGVYGCEDVEYDNSYSI